MPRNLRPPDVETNRPDECPVSLEEDDVLVTASEQFHDHLREYVAAKLNETQDRALIQDYITDGLLDSVLRMVGRDGEYRLDEGRFWQILDRYLTPGRHAENAAVPEQLASEVRSLVAAVCYDVVEDGFDASWSFELTRLVLRHGTAGVETIASVILNGKTAPDVVAAVLRRLGEMRNPATHESRRSLLERSLRNESHVVRDGALVGLAALDDPHAVPFLQTAAAREPYRLLREELTNLAERLKERRHVGAAHDSPASLGPAT